ncbi:hypothetical protein H6P81_002302 [Aristolochia fimbriata]|uniref:CCHC-type domain-containing protein n=1 Tax=Aristolochia fimbriata TaxID=158543 RepID=A0AAV7FB63_ARIFI|nr:hypothetical protein H6P81_002302 [Aristolochia fimbriata]
MAAKPPPEIDDELFDEVYGKEYTGPPGSTTKNVPEITQSNKRPNEGGDGSAGSDDEDELHDPNAVPTDFTSREAKAWVARAKATERNWKKRKEEEMICKLCGESGHFTQGCPSTLGANRKSSDFFQRVAARDKHIRALFTDKVIYKIEKENDCKIKMDEKFIIVSSKNQLSMTKGVDAVHEVISNEKMKGSDSRNGRSRSPEGSPGVPQLRRSESQRSHSSPRRAAGPKVGKQEKYVEDRMREDSHKMPRRSPPARAYGNDGARGRSSHSKSPPRTSYPGSSYSSHDGHSQKLGLHRTDGWDIERRGPDVHSGHKYETPVYAQTLEELELECKREAMELGTIRDKEEDEENYKHREAIRELRESYMKKMALLREYDRPSAANPHYPGNSLSMESRGSARDMMILEKHLIDTERRAS